MELFLCDRHFTCNQFHCKTTLRVRYIAHRCTDKENMERLDNMLRGSWSMKVAARKTSLSLSNCKPMLATPTLNCVSLECDLADVIVWWAKAELLTVGRNLVKWGWDWGEISEKEEPPEGERSWHHLTPWRLIDGRGKERGNIVFDEKCNVYGNPFQCSCLENPRDEGAWWAAIYGVAQSPTRLKWLSSSSSNVYCSKRRVDFYSMIS